MYEDNENNGKVEHGMVIVPQTKIAFIGFILILVAKILFIMQLQDPELKRIFAYYIFAYILIGVIALYVINCTVLGKCNMFAWIYAYIVFALGVIGVLQIIVKNIKS